MGARLYTSDRIASVLFNSDDGQGSLKLLMSLLFDDDPIFLHNVTVPARIEHASNSCGLLDTGGRRVLTVELIYGCVESHASVRELWNGYDYDGVRKLCPNAHVAAPVDMKIQNKMLGLQTHSAR